MNRNPSKYPMPTQSPASQPCPSNQAGAINKQPLENDTPDPAFGCAVKRPQTQQRRGLAPWSAPDEAEHPLTTDRNPLI